MAVATPPPVTPPSPGHSSELMLSFLGNITSRQLSNYMVAVGDPPTVKHLLAKYYP